MHRLLAILPLLTSFSPPLQRCHRARRAITPKAATEDLAALKVPQLKALLKERGLKVSGKKQELIDRLEEHAAAEAPKPPAPTPRVTPGSVPDAQLAETIVDLLVTEILEARRQNSTINPDTLASKREALLARGGTALEEVAQRRLAAAPHDTELAGAVALVRGFQRAEFQLRSRDAMREILRAATLGSAQLDDCFEKLSKEGRLDGPFARYVEELEQQQKAKPGDGLLDRVLVIVRDRVKAEGGASKELRVLARALRCSDEDETREFLSKEFSISLDFAARFEAYVEAAAAFADSSEDGGGASLQGIGRVREVVGELRRQMPV
jgi:hypothetical protein